MKISRIKFIALILVSALALQFLSHSLLGPELRLFPIDGEWFPGAESSIPWKSTAATILYPLKIVLIGPLSYLFKNPEPDTPPPIFLAVFVFYWTVMAVVFHYLLSKIILRKKN